MRFVTVSSIGNGRVIEQIAMLRAEGRATVTLEAFGSMLGFSKPGIYKKAHEGYLPVRTKTQPWTVNVASQRIAAIARAWDRTCSYREAARSLMLHVGTISLWIAKHRL